LVGYGFIFVATFKAVVFQYNPALLADALLALMNNPIEAQEMGKQFKQHVLANYGAKGFINKYLTYIQS
jgi:glycosyltransferase involved in cell wall biosynthesis